MSSELGRFLIDVHNETDRARRKFPDPGGSMTALTEEVGELAKALLDESSERVRAEAVQVATMAARVALEGDHTLDRYRTARGAGPHPKGESTEGQQSRSASADAGRPSERGDFSHFRPSPDANGGAGSPAESPGLPSSTPLGRSSMVAAYIAHPLAGDREANRARASKWVAWAGGLGLAPVADWITLAGEWDEDTGRTLGLLIDCALIERCDVLLLVGPRLSDGMAVEKAHAESLGIPVIDLIGLNFEQAEQKLARELRRRGLT